MEAGRYGSEYTVVLISNISIYVKFCCVFTFLTLCVTIQLLSIRIFPVVGLIMVQHLYSMVFYHIMSYCIVSIILYCFTIQCEFSQSTRDYGDCHCGEVAVTGR